MSNLATRRSISCFSFGSASIQPFRTCDLFFLFLLLFSFFKTNTNWYIASLNNIGSKTVEEGAFKQEEDVFIFAGVNGVTVKIGAAQFQAINSLRRTLYVYSL